MREFKKGQRVVTDDGRKGSVTYVTAFGRGVKVQIDGGDIEDFRHFNLTHASEHEIMPVKYPHITVDLSNVDGNAFAIIGVIRRALRTSRVSEAEIEAFTEEARMSTYDNLLQTCMRWVEVV